MLHKKGVSILAKKEDQAQKIKQKNMAMIHNRVSLTDLSLEEVIQKQRYHKNRDQIILNAEEGIDFDDLKWQDIMNAQNPKISKKVPLINPIGLNFDSVHVSKIFSPSGHMHPFDHNSINDTRREVKRLRLHRVLAQSTKMQSDSLSKWFTSSANPANKMRDIFSLSFKQCQKVNPRGGAFDVSTKPSGFRDHVNQSLAGKSPQYGKPPNLSNVLNFIKPQKNLNQYKAFPKWCALQHVRTRSIQPLQSPE